MKKWFLIGMDSRVGNEWIESGPFETQEDAIREFESLSPEKLRSELTDYREELRDVAVSS